MSKNNRELLEKKLKNVERGAYYFGIIGRISIFMGILGIIISFLPMVISGFNPIVSDKLAGTAIQSVSYVIYGGLFIIARDAFDAIKAVISELEEIV